MRFYEEVESSVKQLTALVRNYFETNPKVIAIGKRIASKLPDASLRQEPRYNSLAKQNVHLQQESATLQEQLTVSKRETINLTDSLNHETEERRELEVALRRYEGLESRLQEYQRQLEELTEAYKTEKEELSSRCNTLQANLELQRKAAGHLKAGLRDSERELLSAGASNYILKNPGEFMIAVGARDDIVEISDAAMERLGYSSRDEIIGREIYSFVDEKDELKTRLKKLIGRSLRTVAVSDNPTEIIKNLTIKSPKTNLEHTLNVIITPQYGPKKPRNEKRGYVGVIISKYDIVDEVKRKPWFVDIWNRVERILAKKAQKEVEKAEQTVRATILAESQERVNEALEELDKITRKRLASS